MQALLIEAAIPRLEDEANDLLMRMTDGRMTLRMQTQRERKGGNRDEAIETLEIVIADELGTRAYEMFSGGERFRIDFAVRIALSKLLAWRAGAPLPTLFIDEGFGTQDAEGRDRILEVIKAIEDRFDPYPRDNPHGRDQGSVPRPYRSIAGAHRLNLRYQLTRCTLPLSEDALYPARSNRIPSNTPGGDHDGNIAPVGREQGPRQGGS